MARGPDWWLASDGKWYPPTDADRAPAPGWWLASDGKWYPPKEADEAPAPGWWLASDGNWYPPDQTIDSSASANPTSAASTKPKPAKINRARTKAPRWRGGRRRGSQPRQSETPSEPQTSGSTPRSPEPPAPELVPDAPATSAPQDRVRPNHNEGVSPIEQIARRNRASRADAEVLASKRAAAASRALGSLQLGSLQLQVTATAEPDAPPAPAVPTATAPAPSRPPLRFETAEGTSPQVQPPRGEPFVPSSRTTSTAAEPSESAATETPTGGAGAAPLLEVKSSPLSADVENLGDRLAIFVDHVELRDRLDRVRQSIAGDDIVDVTVQKKLTGAVLTIESVRGDGIVAKGLRADQADEARRLILDKTQPVRLTTDRTTPSAPSANAGATTTRQPAPRRPKLDEAALLGKLDDLHQAGVLTAHEYAEKVDLVGRLVRLEDLAPSRG